MASSKEKTIDCYFYYNGTCSRGDSCSFRHEPLALGSEIVCELWNQGMCFRPACPFRHSNIDRSHTSNGIPCYFENQSAGCRKPNCPFFHCKPRPFLGETNDSTTLSSLILPNSVSIDVTSSITLPSMTLPSAEPPLILPKLPSSQLQLGNLCLESVQAAGPSILPQQSLHLSDLSDLTIPGLPATHAPTMLPPAPNTLPVGEQSHIGTSFQDQVRMFKEMLLNRKEPSPKSSPKPDKRTVRNINFSSESSGFESDKDGEKTERHIINVKGRKTKSYRQEFKKGRRGRREKSSSVQKDRYPAPARNSRPRQRYDRDYVERSEKQYNRGKQYKTQKAYTSDKYYTTDKQYSTDKYTEKYTKKQYTPEKQNSDGRKKYNDRKKSKKYKEKEKKEKIIDEDEFSEELIKDVEEDLSETEDDDNYKEKPKKIESVVEVVSDELKEVASEGKIMKQNEDKLQTKTALDKSSEKCSEKSSEKSSEKCSEKSSDKSSDKISDNTSDKTSDKDTDKKENILDFHIKSYEEILREKALKKMLERRREIKERQILEAKKKAEEIIALNSKKNTKDNLQTEKGIKNTVSKPSGKVQNIQVNKSAITSAISKPDSRMQGINEGTLKRTNVTKKVPDDSVKRTNVTKKVPDDSVKKARGERFNVIDTEKNATNKIIHHKQEDNEKSNAAKKSELTSSQDSPKKIKFVRKVAIKGSKSEPLETQGNKLKARKSLEIYKPPRIAAVAKNAVSKAGRVSPTVELKRKQKEEKIEKSKQSALVNPVTSKQDLQVKSFKEIMKAKHLRTQQQEQQHPQKLNSLDRSASIKSGISPGRTKIKKIDVRNSVTGKNNEDIYNCKSNELFDDEEERCPAKKMKYDIDEELEEKSMSPPSQIEDIKEALNAELRRKKEDLMSDDELERELDLGDISSGDDLEDLNEDDLLLEIEEMINS